MAENPLRYRDLLQPDNSIEQAISQLEKLNNTYSQTLQNVKSEAIRLQASIENVSGATEQHRTKIRETTAETDKLSKAQKDLEFALSDTAKEIAALKEQQREAQNIAKLTAKLNASEAGSYNALSAQYSLNKIQLNKLSQEYRENTKEGQKLVKETEEIYARMKQLQEATGKFTLNVGNYKSAWDGLGVSAQQLVRELPSLAVSANTFFLAISNNIPMLIDEINRLRASNAAAAAAGEKTVPVWRSVARAFLSWQTALSVGITLLTVFGKDIVNWIANIIRGRKELNVMAEAQKNVNSAMLQGRKDAQQSTARLNILYRATQDTTRSLNERRKAAEELQKMYPSYFADMEKEAILAGDAAKAYNELRDSIQRTSMARAAENKMIENNQKILDLETQRLDATRKLEKAQTELTRQEQLQAAVVGSPTMQGQDVIIAKVRSQVMGYEEDIASATEQITALKTANEDLLNMIDVRDLTAETGQPTATTGGTGRDRSQQIARKNNEITKQLYESQTALITDELKKQRQALLDSYNTEYADLMNRYNNDKDLTEESRENISQIILNKQQKLQKDLEALNTTAQQQELKHQQDALQLRLDAVESNTEEENALRIQLLQNQRQQELLANKQLAEDMQQDEEAINAKYNQAIIRQNNKFTEDKRMAELETAHSVMESRLYAEGATEDQITDFKLQAEKERLQLLLKMVKDGTKQMSDAEIEAVKNTIKGIDNELKKSRKDFKQYGNIFDVIGDGLKKALPGADSEMIDQAMQGVEQYVSFSIEQLGELLQAQIQLKEQQVQNAQEEVEAAQSKVEAEIEARNNGYASSVATAKKELEQAKKNEQKALKEKQKAQKQQEALDTLTQTSSLITAAANIWKSLSGIPLVGPALAVAAIASMFASFAAAKITARQATATATEEYGEGGLEFLEGGSHASGNDIDLGVQNKRHRRMKAEGGEALAIINKKQTRRYRKVLPDIVESLNKGTFEKKYIDAFVDKDKDAVNVAINGAGIDLTKIESDVSRIRKQGETQYYVLSDGTTIIQRKNVKRIIRK